MREGPLPLREDNADLQFAVGLLALAEQAADAGQVTSAVASWLADPSATVGERLQRAGALSASRRSELEAGAARLVAHRGGVETTLPKKQLGDDGPEVSLSGETLLDPDVATRYEMRTEWGRGGQARVMLAYDRQIGREVAWKELLPDGAAPGARDSELRSAASRFLREARITGQLEHPNIVPVYELGRDERGTPYYTMRLVRGRTLAQALEGRPLHERLRLLEPFLAVCRAAAYAHSRGVIHRDVKPGNVIVGEFGETVLLDWGIAKVRGREDWRGRDLRRGLQEMQQRPLDATVAGFAIGTPRYMSPEQAQGRIEAIDERSDVWGLGAVLYEILTGESPFDGATSNEVIERVAYAPLTPARARCPEAPPELAAVAERALQKSPSKRYASASELADDVSAYMTGRRVNAYEYGALELLKKFAARHKAIVVACAVVLAVIVAALLSLSLAYRAESAARRGEQAARERQREEFLNARLHLAGAYAHQAARLMEERLFLSARIYAAASLANNPVYEGSRHFEAAYLQHAPEGDWLKVDALSVLRQTDLRPARGLWRTLRIEASVQQAAFSPDGKWLAGVDASGWLALWAVDGWRQVVRAQSHKGKATGLSFSPDGLRLATVGEDHALLVWQAGEDSPRVRVADAGSALDAVAFSPDGLQIVTGGWEGQVRLWDAATGAPIAQLEPSHGDRVWGLAFSPDGRRLASGSWDKTARLWDLRKRRVERVLTGHADAVYRTGFSPDGKLLSTAGYDKAARVWEVETGKLVSTLSAFTREGVYAASFSHDGRRIATGGADRAVRIWEPTGKLLMSIDAHNDATMTTAFSPDGRWLASGGHDRTIRIWELPEADRLPTLEHTDWVYGVGFSPDGKRLVTASWDRTVRLWSAGERRAPQILFGHSDGIQSATFSRDGRWVASAGADDTVRLWDARSGELVKTLEGGSSFHNAVFSPDGTLLAGAAGDGVTRVWRVPGGELATTLPQAGVTYSVAFSPEGRRLATVGYDKLVHLWELPSGKALAALDGHGDWVSGVDFSPDGRLLASSGKDGRAILWDAQSGRKLRELSGHKQWVNDVMFSHDGRSIATSGDDATAVVWDLASGRPRLRLRTAGAVRRVAFSPDDKTLALPDFDAAVLIPLDLARAPDDPEALLAEYQALAGMKLHALDLRVEPQ